MVSTKAIRPSLLWGAPVKMFFRLSASARQAVSREFSDPPDPDCADASATDCPIRATHSMSGRPFGPLLNKRAWTQAIVFASPDTWSTLLITPTVLVPEITVNRKYITYSNKTITETLRIFFRLEKQTIWINIFGQPQSSRWCNIGSLHCGHHNKQYCIIVPRILIDLK
jgi:hypothetical protein